MENEQADYEERILEGFERWKADVAAGRRPLSDGSRITGTETTIRHLGDGWVPTGGALALPRHFAATIEDTDYPDWVFELEVEVDNFGRLGCRRFAVRSRTGAINGTDLRKMKLPVLLKVAARAAVEKVERREDGSLELLPMAWTELDEFFHRYAGGPRSQRGSALTDEHLRAVAAVYRASVPTGAPNREIAKAFSVSVKTAARWVALARKHRYLGPSIGKRAGEAPRGTEES